MESRTFRATWRIGGWRSVPSLFGLIEVRDAGITARSWHWSWWVKDQEMTRDTIETIKATRQAGTTLFAIHRRDGKPVDFRVNGADGDLMIRELRDHGHVVDDLTV